LPAALKIIDRLRPKQTWLTHIGHTFDDWHLSDDGLPLPPGVSIAADGEVTELGA
jgi:phosphoribosyl 1,2-cyclic phosphate phosphodiesterase